MIGQRLIGREFGLPPRRQTDAPLAAIAILLLDRYKTLRFQRPQQPAEIAGIQRQPRTQGGDVGTIRAGFEKEPRLPLGTTAPQIAVFQRAHPLRDHAMETPNLLDLGRQHSLTLVR